MRFLARIALPAVLLAGVAVLAVASDNILVNPAEASPPVKASKHYSLREARLQFIKHPNMSHIGAKDTPTYCNGPGENTFPIGDEECFCGQSFKWKCTTDEGPGDGGSWEVTRTACIPGC
jgi:hypothetical protein